MKDIVPILRSLGLLESEIKTYLMAFEKGAGTVLDLAKATRLSRQAVYVAIESLSKRSLMTSALHGKKRYYSAEPPDKLLLYAERREQDMKEKIADLKRTIPEFALSMGGSRPIVKVYEGKEGLKAVLEDIQTTEYRGEAVEITDTDAMKAVASFEDRGPTQRELKKRGGGIKGLYAGENARANEIKGERYLLPKELSDFKSNIGIYGDKIALITFEGKMYSVMIESPALTKTMRILFHLAFRGANDFPRVSQNPEGSDQK